MYQVKIDGYQSVGGKFSFPKTKKALFKEKDEAQTFFAKQKERYAKDKDGFARVTITFKSVDKKGSELERYGFLIIR